MADAFEKLLGRFVVAARGAGEFGLGRHERVKGSRNRNALV